MKPKKIIRTLLIILLISGISHFALTTGGEPLKTETQDSLNKSEWQKISAFEEKGLYQSALKEVDNILERSKKQNDSAEIVKALLYKMRFRSEIEENELVREIDFLESTIAESQFPVRPLLQSILGEMIWYYFQNNRYAILDRTITEMDDRQNLETWDVEKFIRKITALYHASLDAATEQKAVPLDVYNAILISEKDGISKKYRPTLYDFLAHRAIDFFLQEEPGIIRPASEFHFQKEEVFLPAREFLKISFPVGYESSLKYQAFKILKDLIEHHLNDETDAALIDVDLKRLKFVHANSSHKKKDDLYIHALARMEETHRDSPESCIVSYQLASFHYNRGNQYVFGEKNLYREDLKKAFDIVNAAIRRFPEAEEAENLKALQSLILTKKLSAEFENVNTPGKPFRALINFQNVTQIYVRAIPLTPEEHQKITDECSGSRNYFDDLVARFRNEKSTVSFDVMLPDPGDYQSHSAEIRIPSLDPGFYVILIGTSPDFSTEGNAVATADVWVSNLGYIQKDTRNGTPLFYLFDRETGKPVQNASVQIWVDEYDKEKRRYVESKGMIYRTKQDGEVEIPYLKKENRTNGQYHRFKLDISHKGERLFLNEFLRGWGYRNYNPEKPEKSTFFFTDRKLYRPGQRLYFKGIMLQKEKDTYAILPLHSTTVEILDANHKSLSQLKLTSNSFGTFSGSFILPENSLTGTYYLQNSLGTMNFLVEEYKRPKFEVLLHPLKESFRLGNSVKVKGKAMAYAGAPIDQALVKFRVARSVAYPFWKYGWQIIVPSGHTEAIASGTTKTDGEGNFEFHFTALSDPLIPEDQLPEFTFEVTADVTDVGGETHSARSDILIGNIALSADIDVPESINREKKISFPIKTENLSGEFEPAKGTISIYELVSPGRIMRERLWSRPDLFTISKEDYLRDFPNDVYDDENIKENWETKQKVLEYFFDTGKEKKLEVDMTAWKQGEYRLEMAMTDRFGTPVQIQKFFSLFGSKEPSLPLNTLIWNATLTAEGEPGDTASFLWGSTAGDIHARLEVYHNNQIVDSYILSANSRKQMINLPIKEKYRGNFSISLMFVKYGRLNQFKEIIKVPWSNKKLNITYETFRDKIRPNEEEQWRLKITGPEKEKVTAEMVASLYDASLDAIAPHDWDFSIYPENSVEGYYHEIINSISFQKQQYQAMGKWNVPYDFKGQIYDRLNWFGFSPGNFGDPGIGASGPMIRSLTEDSEDNGSWSADMRIKGASAAAITEKSSASPGTVGNGQMQGSGKNISKKNTNDFVRKNLQETAFFYPHLQTSSDGDILISFTTPETLTRWKLMSFAHSKDLLYTVDKREIVTQKEIMVTPHLPRFLRENDEMIFTGKISNLTDRIIDGKAYLKLHDAYTMKPVDDAFSHAATPVPFKLEPNGSQSVSWKIKISDTVEAVSYRMTAETKDFSDGEEAVLPILKNRTLITQTLPMTVRGKGEKSFKMEKLADSGKSKTLSNHRLTLEFTSNPAFLAIQSLPYLLEQTHSSSEYIFNKLYANTIAEYLIKSDSSIKNMIDSWQKKGRLASNLEKKQELKYISLEETPWIKDAESETERMRRLSLLFDSNTIKNENTLNIKRLKQMQMESGGFVWFSGMGENPFITQYIISGFGRLIQLGVLSMEKDLVLKEMIHNALLYMDENMTREYQLIRGDKDDPSKHPVSVIQIHYLYARSFFKDNPLKKEHEEALQSVKKQAQKFWKDFSIYGQGLTAMALSRMGDNDTALSIAASLKERALYSKEMGMYWKENKRGYFWHTAPIETQALLIELFHEVLKDQGSVNEMRIWLLKRKQTEHWESGKATADACYALILRGSDWLKSTKPVKVSIGGIDIVPSKNSTLDVESGTGYFKKSWNRESISPSLARIQIEKQDDILSWGALYWQYFEDLDKITSHETPLSINRSLFFKKDEKKGAVIAPITTETALTAGDTVTVRIEIRSDRDMEFVHLKDIRAVSLEPVDSISQTKYQAGLSYYMSIRDAATHFFFERLPKGTHLFEFDLRITHRGNFSSGITTIQSLYAPEFTAHSRGGRLIVH